MPTATGKIILNGMVITVNYKPGTTLLELLRHNLGLTGAKEGCNHGDCGACTVLLNGKPVASCVTPVEKAIDKEVLTVEGLSTLEKLHPIQEAFIESGAVQCGFCTPGMLMSSVALLNSNNHPSDAEIVSAISGNICRCTGYKKIIEAIKNVADTLN